MNATKALTRVYRVLHIENDEFLLKGFQSCATDELGTIAAGVKVEIVPAQTISGAMAALGREPPRFDVLIVDLMLPRNDADHRRGRALQIERRKFVRQLFEEGKAEPAVRTEEVLGLKMRISQLDEELKGLIVDDGGLEIIGELVKKNQGKRLQRPVIFWTARCLPTIRERCLASLQPGSVQIFEKPEREIEVLRATITLANKWSEIRL